MLPESPTFYKITCVVSMCCMATLVLLLVCVQPHNSLRFRKFRGHQLRAVLPQNFRNFDESRDSNNYIHPAFPHNQGDPHRPPWVRPLGPPGTQGASGRAWAGPPARRPAGLTHRPSGRAPSLFSRLLAPPPRPTGAARTCAEFRPAVARSFAPPSGFPRIQVAASVLTVSAR